MENLRNQIDNNQNGNVPRIGNQQIPGRFANLRNLHHQIGSQHVFYRCNNVNVTNQGQNQIEELKQKLIQIDSKFDIHERNRINDAKMMLERIDKLDEKIADLKETVKKYIEIRKKFGIAGAKVDDQVEKVDQGNESEIKNEEKLLEAQTSNVSFVLSDKSSGLKVNMKCDLGSACKFQPNKTIEETSKD